MQIYFSDSKSELYEGLVLFIGKNRLRLVVRNWPEAIEIHYRDGRWITEDGRGLTLEAIINDGTSMEDIYQRFLTGIDPK